MSAIFTAQLLTAIHNRRIEEILSGTTEKEKENG